MTAWIARILLSVAVFATIPADNDAINHILERTSFGVRAGDVEHVQSVGIERYIDEQLHPDRLSDPGLQSRLQDLGTLRMSSREIAETFERPAIEAREAAAKSGSSDVTPAPEIQQRANS